MGLTATGRAIAHDLLAIHWGVDTPVWRELWYPGRFEDVDKRLSPESKDNWNGTLVTANGAIVLDLFTTAMAKWLLAFEIAAEVLRLHNERVSSHDTRAGAEWARSKRHPMSMPRVPLAGSVRQAS